MQRAKAPAMEIGQNRVGVGASAGRARRAHRPGFEECQHDGIQDRLDKERVAGVTERSEVAVEQFGGGALEEAGHATHHVTGPTIRARRGGSPHALCRMVK